MNLGQLKQFGEMQVKMMQEFVDLVDRVQELEERVQGLTKEKFRLQNENDNLRGEIHNYEATIDNLLEELNGADPDPDCDCDYCDCGCEDTDDTYNANDLPDGINIGDRVFIKGTQQGCGVAEGYIGYVTNDSSTNGWMKDRTGAVNVKWEQNPSKVYRVNKDAIHKVNP